MIQAILLLDDRKDLTPTPVYFFRRAQESWAVYFRYLTDKGKRYKINEILEHEEGIAMASDV
ncbi:MAG: hypothetical protein FWH35_08270, partial [Treponema sp.]|nr:hypothetical protein [Treponema sp.]